MSLVDWSAVRSFPSLTKQDKKSYDDLFDPFADKELVIQGEIPIKEICRYIDSTQVRRIIQLFYERVFDDTDNGWFRNVFVGLSTLEYLVQSQSQFWILSFGGNEMYAGGKRRIVEAHDDPEAESILDVEGANRWLYHMNLALIDIFEEIDIEEKEPVRRAIHRFIKICMKRYAADFHFDFDALDWYKFPSDLEQD
eukprot:TRINITY_DN2570_c0_g1_i1.p1 TRINITY_DN2570_c0_g1~~TRINITY_DN2570_c0_g1_i1.p1  ORF type:complete len:196 (+),score=43.77 TRINITY_DN2570_c0_g1_i1:13-600(+)